MSDEPVPEERHESIVRRAFLRVLLVSGALAVLLTATQLVLEVAIQGTGFTKRILLEPAILGLSVGILAGPTALVELVARRFRSTLRRDAVAGLLAGAVAFLLVAFAILQWAYTYALAEGLPLTLAWARLLSVWMFMKHNKAGYACLFASSGVLFGSLSFARLREIRLARQPLVLLAGCAFVSFPLLAFMPKIGIKTALVATWTALGSALLPFLGALADSAEERVLSWASGEPRPPRAPLRERLRGGIAPFLLVLLVAGGLAVAANTLLAWHALSPEQKAEAELLPELESLAATKLSPAEAALVISRTLALEETCRPTIGGKDDLHVSRRFRRVIPAGWRLVIDSLYDVDDVAGFSSGISYGWTELQQPDPVIENHLVFLAGRLAPGEHTVTAHHQIVLSRQGTRVWSATRTDRHSVRVIEAPTAIRTSAGDGGASLEVEQRGEDLLVQLTAGTLALSGLLQVRDEAGTVLVSFDVFARPDSTSSWSFRPSIAKGRHDLEVRLVPNPKAAIESDATTEEIVGATLDRSVVYTKD